MPEARVERFATQALAGRAHRAFAAFQEKTTGSIEVGKLADVVVLDKDLTQVSAHEIARVKVVRTFVEGERIH